MDFIALEVDETWKAFQQPQSVYSEVYEPSRVPKSPFVKLAQNFSTDTGCTGPTNNETCSWNYNQIPQYGITVTLGGLYGSNPTTIFGDKFPTDEHQEAERDVENNTETEEQRCNREQSNESQRDALAENIANEIRGRHNVTGNPNNVELGAFILRIENGDGSFRTVRVSRLTRGSTGSVSLNTMLRQAQREYPGIDASNIVGAVHLHPSGPVGSPPIFDTDGHLSDLDFGNLMPTHPNLVASRQNDWDSLSRFVQANGRTDTTGLSHYILGPDGVLREYDYSDGHPAETGEVQAGIDVAEDDANGACT